MLLIAVVACRGPGPGDAVGQAGRQDNPEGFRSECVAEPLLRGASQEPVLVERHEPVYSPEARESKVSGFAMLSLAISSSGVVCDAKFVRRLDPAVDKAILEAVLRWRFKPAMLNGKPIALVYYTYVRVDLRTAYAATPNTSLQRTAGLRPSAAELMVR